MLNKVVSMVSIQFGMVAALEFSQKGDLLLISSDTNDLNSCPLTLNKIIKFTSAAGLFLKKYLHSYYFCDGVFLLRSWGIIFLAVGETL